MKPKHIASAFALSIAFVIAIASIAIVLERLEPPAVHASSPATIKTVQVTIGSGTTEVTTTNTFCRQIFFENNTAHSMRIGDSTATSSKGVLLVASVSSSWTVSQNFQGSQSLDLSDYYVAGTQNDVLDVACIQ